MKLADISYYVKDKIDSNSISLEEYVTTESLLPNKEGIEIAQKLPPPCKLTHFKEGDILLSNIRPYLKKIWMANFKGGCSSDVIVFRVKEGYSPYFLYSILLQDSFFNYIMNSVKGSKMPRGNKDEILNFEFPIFSFKQQENIGGLISILNKKITLNRAINHNLVAMAKQLYDYWFVQFDFPNEDGNPYKSSGGKMVWNEKLKREIPERWGTGSLLDIAVYTNGLACQKFRPINDNRLPVIKIKEMHDGITSETEYVRGDIPEVNKIYAGDVLFSWSASLEIMLWSYGLGGLNQHIFKVTSKNGYPRSFYFYQLTDYIGHFKKIAETRKTTMGHITQDHLQQSIIPLPPTNDMANKLEQKLCPIFNAIISNNQEIIFLTKQRDELLPLLMNGQVTVG